MSELEYYYILDFICNFSCNWDIRNVQREEHDA